MHPCHHALTSYSCKWFVLPHTWLAQYWQCPSSKRIFSRCLAAKKESHWSANPQQWSPLQKIWGFFEHDSSIGSKKRHTATHTQPMVAGWGHFLQSCNSNFHSISTLDHPHFYSISTLLPLWIFASTLFPLYFHSTSILFPPCFHSISTLVLYFCALGERDVESPIIGWLDLSRPQTRCRASHISWAPQCGLLWLSYIS